MYSPVPLPYACYGAKYRLHSAAISNPCDIPDRETKPSGARCHVDRKPRVIAADRKPKWYSEQGRLTEPTLWSSLPSPCTPRKFSLLTPHSKNNAMQEALRKPAASQGHENAPRPALSKTHCYSQPTAQKHTTAPSAARSTLRRPWQPHQPIPPQTPPPHNPIPYPTTAPSYT